MNLKKKQLRRLIEKSFGNISNFYDRVDVQFEILENSKSFWSEVYKVVLTSEEDIDIPNELFVKIPKLTDNVVKVENPDEENDHMNNLINFCKNENLFYETINEPIPNFPIPKVYYTENITGEGTGGMVAESLINKVYAMEFLPGFQDSQVLRLMEALAGFHSYVLKKGTSFLRMFNKSDITEIYPQEMQSLMYSESLSLEQIDPTNFGNGRIQKLKHLFDYDAKNMAFKKCSPKVLVHSDLNATNILWCKGSDELRAIIDFQMIHEGSIAHDIIRVLTLGLSKSNRLQNTERYLKYYYNILNQLFDGNLSFTFKELQIQYNLIFPFTSNFTLFGIAIYWKMYNDGVIGKIEEKQKNCEELLSRALGIVEDIERIQ